MLFRIFMILYNLGLEQKILWRGFQVPLIEKA